MDLFKSGSFTSHSGVDLPYKIECDALSVGDIKCIVGIAATVLPDIREVYGIPTGGYRLSDAFQQHLKPVGKVLIIDDVLTTGNSFDMARANIMDAGIAESDIIGFVVFARGAPSSWIRYMFMEYRKGIEFVQTTSPNRKT